MVLFPGTPDLASASTGQWGMYQNASRRPNLGILCSSHATWRPPEAISPSRNANRPKEHRASPNAMNCHESGRVQGANDQPNGILSKLSPGCRGMGAAGPLWPDVLRNVSGHLSGKGGDPV